MKPLTILNSQQFELTIKRLCFQLIENHEDFSDTVIIGLQPRGIFLADRMVARPNTARKSGNLRRGHVALTHYTAEFRRLEDAGARRPAHIARVQERLSAARIEDVLLAGRTIRTGPEALVGFGRPQ